MKDIDGARMKTTMIRWRIVVMMWLRRIRMRQEMNIGEQSDKNADDMVRDRARDGLLGRERMSCPWIRFTPLLWDVIL